MLKKTGKITKTLFGCASALALFACSPANNEYSLQEKQTAVKGGVMSERLTTAEWSTYMADHRYVNSLVKPNVRARLNFADPKQHRFAMARLKLAGKNAKNSPYLFELIEQRRKDQLKAGIQAGVLGEEQINTPITRSEQHLITAASAPMRSNRPGAAAAVEVPGRAAMASTYPDGAFYTWADLSYSTASGFPLAEPTYTEEFENEGQAGLVGANIALEVEADTGLSNEKQWVVSTYKFEDSATGFTDSYQIDEFGAGEPVQTLEAIQMERIKVLQPVDVVGNDNIVHICVNRAWNTDCDYEPIGPNGWWDIQLPLKGELVISSGHKFDRAYIADQQATGSEGSMALLLMQRGGGCVAVDTLLNSHSMLPFWQRVTLDQGDRRLSWDLSGEETFFDRACAWHDNARLTVRIPLVLTEPPLHTELVKTSITMSTDPRELPPDPQGNEDGRLQPIMITNSCLAEGTEVQLKGNKTAAIENLKAGQEVFNPFDKKDRELTITDTSKGIEPAPMVRIKDEAGRTLMLTEMHPISTPDRGMVQARWLRAGDMVDTKDGPSKLAEVTREAYSGKVYNLKVGSDSEMKALGPDQTIFYANGFTVGDGQIQSKYEDLALKNETTATIANIPPQWKQDYLLSPTSKKATK